MRRFVLLSITGLLAPLAVPAAAPAQDLGLTVEAGSIPGPVRMTVGPFVPNGVFGVVFLSFQTASIPWAVLDASDPRSLSIGLELGSISPFGLVSGGSGVWMAPSFGIPNQPSSVDAALFFQATYIPGPQYFIGPMSYPTVVRFGLANSVRERGTLMTAARAFFQPVPLADGRVLVAGGGSGGLLSLLPNSQADLYDPLTDSFDPGAGGGRFMFSERALYTATELLDGRIVFIGGVNLTNDPVRTIEFFDPATGLFAPGATMMTDPRMGHSATLLPDGRVFVAGGLSDMTIGPGPLGQLDPIFSTLATSEIYDPWTDTWSPGPALGAPRAGHGAIPLASGQVVLAGGISYTGLPPVQFPAVVASTDVITFGPTPTRAAGPSMGTPRSMFSLIETGDGRWLAAGGVHDALANSPTNTAEIYDPAGNAWTPIAPMAGARGLHAAFPWGPGRFLHVMGAAGTLLGPLPLATSEIYDLASNTWSAGPTSPLPRAAFGSYENGHGQIHVLGGVADPPMGPTPVGARTTDAWVYR